MLRKSVVGRLRSIPAAHGTKNPGWHPTANRLDVKYELLATVADDFQFHKVFLRALDSTGFGGD
jgi:hypothetical protein